MASNGEQSDKDRSAQSYAERAAQVYGEAYVVPRVRSRAPDADRWRALETAEHLAGTLAKFSEYMVGPYEAPPRQHPE